MCRVATTEFGAALSSATLARRWIADRFGRWELTTLTDTATLLLSELVTNAVVHTASRPAVTAAVTAGLVEVGVTDRDTRLPRPVVPHGEGPTADAAAAAEVAAAEARVAEGGRGLWIVERLAQEWGATSLAHGKHVWLRLDAEDWSYRSDCRCREADAERVRLASGRYVLHIRGPWDHVDGPRVD